MKSTGIVRKVDELGRIVVPMELRRTLDIKLKDPMEVFMDGEKIVLKKYESDHECMLTGEINPNNLSLANGKIVISPTAAAELLEKLERHVQ